MSDRRSFVERAVDSTVGIFSPRAELRRIVHRANARNYIDGTGFSRERRFFPRVLADHDRTVGAWARNDVMAVARRLYFNLGLVRKLVRQKANWSASTFVAKYAGSEDREWGKQAEFWFNKQFAKICDVTGRFDLETFAWLNSAAMSVDGELFWILTESQSGFPMLQAVRAHRVRGQDGDGSDDGIFRNAAGRPNAYSVSAGINERGRETFAKLPAAAVHHVGDASWSDEGRYLSGFVHACGTLQDLQDTVGFEKIAQKAASAIGIIRRNPTGTPDPLEDDTVGEDKAAGLPLETFLAGIIPYLAEGESIESFESRRPANEWHNFTQHLIRDVCAGLDWHLALAWSTSEIGGPDARVLLADADLSVKRHQKPIVRWGERVWTYAISKAVKNGYLPPAPEDWWQVRFQLPPRPSIDIGRQAAADLNLYEAGLMSGDEIVGARGGDFDEVQQRKAEEAQRRKELATEYGVEPEEIAAKVGPPQAAPQPEPAAKPKEKK